MAKNVQCIQTKEIREVIIVDPIRRIKICMILEEMSNYPDCAKRLGLIDCSHMCNENDSLIDESSKALKKGAKL